LFQSKRAVPFNAELEDEVMCITAERV